MSYTHTLSIQGVHAILQMNVEHLAVQYTLTLRADSGEEVVANGHLPNDAMDHFTVINQYVTNPVTMEESHRVLETESISPILPSSPKHSNDSCIGEKLRECYNLPAGGSETQEKPLTPVPDVRAPCNELAIIKQLQHLRQYSEPDMKLGLIQAVRKYLVDNNIDIRNYCILGEYMKELFYEMIVLHIDDNVMVDKCVEMLLLAGEPSHEVNEYKTTMTNQYTLFCKIAAYQAITIDSTSFAAYQAWKKTYRGYSLNRFHLMKMFLQSHL